MGCQNHLAPGPNQQRVTGRLSKPGQGSAHCRSAQSQPTRSTGHAAIGKQCVECNEQIQVGFWHA
jgi:hypothetical protein